MGRGVLRVKTLTPSYNHKGFEPHSQAPFHRLHSYRYRDPRKSPDYSTLQKAFEDLGMEDADEHVHKSENTFCFLEFAVGGAAAGDLDGAKVIIELLSQNLPMTCENFRALCTGEKGEAKSGTKLHFANTEVHRIVADGWVQMGDIESGRGDGGESIYGKKFADESYIFKHDAPGMTFSTQKDSTGTTKI